MKYPLIINAVVFQFWNVQLATTSFPISKQIPITAIACVAPEKMDIKPTMEYQAATVEIASATKSVNKPKNIIQNVPLN